MRKRWVALSVIVIAVVVLGYWAKKRGSEPKPRTHVVVAQAAKTLLYLPLYIAQDRGFFNDEAIDVEISTAGGDSQAFAALASGEAQFAQGDPVFVAIANERGGPGIVVASVLDRVAFWGVSFDDKLKPFDDPKFFRGLSVVTYPEPNTAYEVQKSLLLKAGLRPGIDSRIIQTTFGSELGPLQSGQAQVSVSIEPTVSQAVSQRAHVVYSYPNGWGPFLLTGLMTSSEFANKNPATVQGIVDGYERALRLIRANPELAKAVGRKYFPEVSESVINSALNRLTSENVFPDHAVVNLQSWRSAVQLRFGLGELKISDHDSLVDNRFADAALQLK